MSRSVAPMRGAVAAAAALTERDAPSLPRPAAGLAAAPLALGLRQAHSTSSSAAPSGGRSSSVPRQQHPQRKQYQYAYHQPGRDNYDDDNDEDDDLLSRPGLVEAATWSSSSSAAAAAAPASNAVSPSSSSSSRGGLASDHSAGSTPTAAKPAGAVNDASSLPYGQNSSYAVGRHTTNGSTTAAAAAVEAVESGSSASLFAMAREMGLGVSPLPSPHTSFRRDQPFSFPDSSAAAFASGGTSHADPAGGAGRRGGAVEEDSENERGSVSVDTDQLEALLGQLGQSSTVM